MIGLVSSIKVFVRKERRHERIDSDPLFLGRIIL